MENKFLVSSRVWKLATDFDYRIAEMVREDGCPHCRAGKLHFSNYLLKTRGIRGNSGNFLRLSFCCDQRSCRRRITPASVRFRHQGVYANAYYKKVTSAMNAMNGAEFRRELSGTEISDRTLRRWKKGFIAARPQIIPNIFRNNASLDSETLLTNLLEDFGGDKSAFYACLETISTETLVFLANQKNRFPA